MKFPAQAVTVSAFGAVGNPDPTYTGTVHFANSDAQAGLPADYAFTTADHGVHTFSVTLKTAGSQSLTVSDGGAFASSAATVQVTPTAASTFTVAGPAGGLSSGVAGSVTVTARHAFGNLATAYSGTVHSVSADDAATLPADYTFTAADQGVHTFSATLRTVGYETLSVTDTHTPSVSGQASVAVLPLAGLSGPAAGAINQPLTFTLRGSGGA